MSEKKFFRVTDFSGGLNKDQHAILLEPNQGTEVQNFRLDKIGSLVSRQGLTQFIPAYPVAPVVQMGVWRKPTDLDFSRVLAHLVDGTIQYVDESTSTYVQLADGFGVTRGKFTNAEDKVLYANGERIPVVYDGNSAYSLGREAPASAPVLVDSGGGTLNGTYSYVYTWMDYEREIESNASSPATVSPSTEKVTVSRGAIPDGVGEWRIYRLDPGSSVFRFLASVDGSTSSYDDTGAVALSPLSPPVSNNPAPRLTNMAFYNGYYFGMEDNLLRWSSPLTPHAWPALNSSELPFEGNDKVMALVSYQDALLIFGRTNILLVQGQAGQWSVVRLDISMGLVGSDAVVEAEGQVLFLSDSGLRVYPGFSVFSPNIARTLGSYSLAQREAAILDVSPSENAVWLVVGGVTYSITIPSQAASVYTLAPTAVVGGGKTGFAPNILSASDGGNIYNHVGVWDDGTPIAVRWYSKIFQLENPESTKFIRRLGAFASEGSGSTVTITISDTNTSRNVNLTAQSRNTILWDEFDWEDDSDPNTNYQWTNEGIIYFIGALPAQTLVGMNIQIKIDSTLANPQGQPTPPIEIVPPITLLYRESLRFLGR